MFVEAQALRENKTIGLRRNHLNFAFPDISSSISSSSDFEVRGVFNILILISLFYLAKELRIERLRH